MKKIICLILLTVLLFTGCTTIVSKYEIDVMVKEAKSYIAVKKDGKNNLRVELGGGLIFPAVFSGSINADVTDDFVINIDRMNYYNNWFNGWTEAVFDASGKLAFKKKGDGYECEVVQKPVILDIVSGNIRYFDDYLTGDKGTASVKNRFARIRSVNEFLKTEEYPPYFPHPSKNVIPDETDAAYFVRSINERINSDDDRNFVHSLYDIDGEYYSLRKDITAGNRRILHDMLFKKYKFRNSFKSSIMGFLFPELVLDSAIYTKETKDAYRASSKDLQLGDSIFWNKKYTDAVFPEHLKELRNTGSIYRDFEESMPMFYMEYNFDYYFDKYINGRIFNLKK